MRRKTLNIIDVNLLVYAYDPRSPHHEKCKSWWEGLLRGNIAVGLPWSVILGFVRTTTNRRVLTEPFSWEEAFEKVDAWLAVPHVIIISPGQRHLDLLKGVLNEMSVTPNLVTDAHLAALAMEYRAIIHTHDSDFRRFSGVRLHDPLATPS